MLAIGNGESRAGINIDQIKDHKIGCNAVLRDFRVNHLVCVDRKMVREAIETNYNKNSLIYTRQDWIQEFRRFPGVRELPALPYSGNARWDDPFHWGSGPYAVLLACLLTETERVGLVGFDLYSENQFVNNIYKGTDNYNDTDTRPVDPRYWIQQIGKLFEIYSSIEFTIYQKVNWQLPDLWHRSNVSVDSIEKLL